MNREELINAALEHQSKFETCDGEGTLVGFANGMHKQSYESFIAGAEWQAKQLSWISVEERLPEDNENIVIMCEHGAIFNGVYCDEKWFCMDGYIHDIYKDRPIYSSMSSIPSLWKPVAWMPIPTFDQILESNKDVLQRMKENGN